MTKSNTWFIRDAIASDAESIISVHQNAVHQSANQSYDQAILDEWSPLLSTRVISMQDKIANNPEQAIIVVIVLSDGQVAGFAEIVPSLEELRAVYIEPKYSRLGLGTALLQEIETRAVKQGLAKLILHSSLNAKNFYLKNHYAIDGEGHHQLASGQLMPCIFMSKDLTTLT